MAQDSWEKYVNTGSEIRADYTTGLIHDRGDEARHAGGRTLDQDYTALRAREIQKRNQEVFHNIRQFYCSRKGVLLEIISVAACLLTSTLSPDGFILWNLIFAIIVWAYYEMAVTSEVRDEWSEVWGEITKT